MRTVITQIRKKDPQVKTRIYTKIDEEIERPFLDANRATWPRDLDEEERERLVAVAKKEWRALLREVRPAVLRTIDILDESQDDVTVNFSRNAGCSCGCSPGWIVTGLTGFDVWVEITKEEN